LRLSLSLQAHILSVKQITIQLGMAAQEYPMCFRFVVVYCVCACNVIVPALSAEAKSCLKALIASVKSLQSRLGWLGRSLDGMVRRSVFPHRA
jgi:hypothetical protein